MIKLCLKYKRKISSYAAALLLAQSVFMLFSEQTVRADDVLEIPAQISENVVSDNAAPVSVNFMLARTAEDNGIPISGNAVKLNFKWGDDDAAKDAEGFCWYTDDFFTEDATVYQPSLATMSMTMAMACSGSGEITDESGNIHYEYWSKNGIQLLKDMGFAHPENNETENKLPGLDTVGVTLGYKMVKDGSGNDIPLIAVGIRGSNYRAEWGGNVTVGNVGENEGDHEGFYKASTEVLRVVDAYIQSHDTLKNASNIKFWISGFSRAAATSNLTAARLDRAIETGAADSAEGRIAGKLAKENLYAYTFETPSGGIRDNRLPDDASAYSNIFNVINPQDLVPMVAPADFGFGQYGINMILPTKENHINYSDLKAHMFKYWPAGEKDYKVDNFTPYKITYVEIGGYKIPLPEKDSNGLPSQGLFMDAFVNNLAINVVKSRPELVEKYQAGLRLLVQELMSDSGKIKSKTELLHLALSMFSQLFKHPIVHIKIYIALMIQDLEMLKANLPPLIAAAAKENKIDIDEAYATKLVTMCGSVIDLMLVLLPSDWAMTATLAYTELLNSGIEQAHALSLEKAWLESMDSNYDVPEQGLQSIDYETVMLSGEYRLVRIYSPNKNLQVSLKKTDGTQLYMLGGDALTATEEGKNTVIAGIDADKQYNFYLPTNQGYQITISLSDNAEAGETAELYYSAAEYNPSVERNNTLGYMKRWCFYNLPLILAKGETLTAAIARFTEEEVRAGIKAGSNYDYQLYKAGTAVSSITDYKLAELPNKYANIRIVENSEEFGVTFGEGLRMIGNHAVLAAYPLWDGRFDGWYRDEACTDRIVDPVTHEPIGEVYEFDITESGTKTYYAKFSFIETVSEVSAVNSSTTRAAAVTLNWKVPQSVEDEIDTIYGYNIYRKAADGAYPAEPLATAAGADLTTYTDTTAAAGTEYFYMIRVLSKYQKDGKYIESAVDSNEASVKAGLYWSYTDPATGDVASGYSFTSDTTRLPQGVQVHKTQINSTDNKHFRVPTGYEYLDSANIKLNPENAEFIAPASLTLTLGSQYNGRTVCILHDKDVSGSGDVEAIYAVVENGNAVIPVNSLSPFFITIAKTPVPNPTPTKEGTQSTGAAKSYPIPYAPQYVQAQNCGRDAAGRWQVLLVWQLPAMDSAGLKEIAGYNIYRDGVLLGRADGVNTLFYVDAGVELSKTYTYTIKSLGIEGGVESVASKAVSITVKEAAEPVTVTANSSAAKETMAAGKDDAAEKNDTAGKDDTVEKDNTSGKEDIIENNNTSGKDDTKDAVEETSSVDNANAIIAGPAAKAWGTQKTLALLGGIAGAVVLAGAVIFFILKRKKER